MNEDIKNLEKVLEKYRFTEPVSPEERDRVIANQKRSLQASMRRLGRYNPLYAAVLAVFFLTRRMGMGLSMLQSAVVLVIAGAAVVASVSLGGYLAYRSLQAPPLPHEQAVEVMESRAIGHDIRPSLVQEPPALVKPCTRTISFESLQAVGVSPQIVSAINDSLLAHLKRLRGEHVTSSPGGAAILRGEVSTARGGYSLFLRLVEPDGGIIFSAGYDAPTPRGLLDLCGRAARELSGRVE